MIVPRIASVFPFGRGNQFMSNVVAVGLQWGDEGKGKDN